MTLGVIALAAAAGAAVLAIGALSRARRAEHRLAALELSYWGMTARSARRRHADAARRV